MVQLLLQWVYQKRRFYRVPVYTFQPFLFVLHYDKKLYSGIAALYHFPAGLVWLDHGLPKKPPVIHQSL